MPSGTKYAYLCVWNYNNWKPVHWGKITGDVALFSGNGERHCLFAHVLYEQGDGSGG